MATTAAAATRPRTSSGHHARPDLLELVLFGGAILAAALVLLPVLLVAMITFTGCAVVCHQRRWPRWVPGLVMIIALLTWLAWARWLGHVDPIDVLLALGDGYLTAYLTLAVALGEAMQAGVPVQAIGGWGDWLRAVWLTATVAGVPLGAVATFVVSHPRSETETGSGDEPWTIDDVGVAAQGREEPVAWVVPRVIGQGVMSLVSGPPGIGKSYWTWGIVRALQDGPEPATGKWARFFGLPVHRLHVRRWHRRGQGQPAKVLWCTEEGRSLEATARRFGIAPGIVCRLRRDQVSLTDWPELARRIRHEAWAQGCRLVVIDTIRAWCPQAETSNDAAAAVMRVARQQLAEPGLAVLFVHHDRKGGGDYGEGVAGAYNLVGSVDVLIELRRVQGTPAARRMVVSRRFGELDLTATLDGAHYRTEDEYRAAHPAEGAAAPPEPEPDPIPAYLRGTLAVLQTAKVPLLTADVLAAITAPRATVLKHLAALKELGVLTSTGAGTRREPYRWQVVGAEEPEPEPKPPAPTSDPAYVKYLGSKAWADKRAAVLDRAGGACEVCGIVVPEDDTLEVHHVTYQNWGHEPLDELAALCPADHRRAHA